MNTFYITLSTNFQFILKCDFIRFVHTPSGSVFLRSYSYYTEDFCDFEFSIDWNNIVRIYEKSDIEYNVLYDSVLDIDSIEHSNL